jgi:CRP-like cAMP-binding protein
MEKVYSRGEIIIREGEQDKALYLLKSGRLGILKSDRLISEIRKPGMLFGEMSILLDQPRSATVKALTPCVVEVYEGDTNALLENYPQATRLILKSLAERLVEATTKLHRYMIAEDEHKTGIPGSSSVSFEDLTAMDDRVIERVIESVSNDVLVAALLGTTPRVRNKFFSNMSRGKAHTIKEDMYVAISCLTQELVESAKLRILKKLDQIQRHGAEERRDKMRDEDKTKQQLIDELMELRQRVEKFESLETGRGLRIGEILMEMGCLTRLQLVRYLQKQKEEMENYTREHRQKRLGEVLLESGIITEEDLHKALAEQQRRKRQEAQRSEQ